jgi:hypothetical protein
MGTNGDPQADRERRAVLFCEGNIRWYERNKTRSGQAYAVLQTAALLLSGVTPVLILWDALPRLATGCECRATVAWKGLILTVRH